MQRFNIYDLPHKALRNILNEVNMLFGKTNYNQEKELKQLKDKLLKLMALLASHAHIEDSLLIKPLEEKGVVEFSKDQEEHKRLDAMLFNLSSGLLQLNSKMEDANEKGRILYLLFNQFNGEYLLHMYREETESLEVVLKNMTDEELFSVRDSILAKTPPNILLDWYWYSLPAQSHQERVASLQSILGQPDEKIKATLTVVKSVLPDDEFKAVLKSLDLKIV